MDDIKKIGDFLVLSEEDRNSLNITADGKYNFYGECNIIRDQSSPKDNIVKIIIDRRYPIIIYENNERKRVLTTLRYPENEKAFECEPRKSFKIYTVIDLEGFNSKEMTSRKYRAKVFFQVSN